MIHFRPTNDRNRALRTKLGLVSLTVAIVGVALLATENAYSTPSSAAAAPVGGDDEPCVVACPGDVTTSNDPDQCGAVVTFSAPTVTGDCGPVLCTPPSGSFFPVGTTTVTCAERDNPDGACTFTVTVNDTQPPSIACTANVTAFASAPGVTSAVVNFAAPTASDNCPGVTATCTPPSGSTFPLGTTTVTCTATDASGNTATCSFTVTVFDMCLQDDSNAARKLVWNSLTGEYRFCCNGTVYTGVGTATKSGNVYTLIHNPVDRRVLGKVDAGVKRGSASIQAPPGAIQCTIMDRDIRNNACGCP